MLLIGGPDQDPNGVKSYRKLTLTDVERMCLGCSLSFDLPSGVVMALEVSFIRLFNNFSYLVVLE